MKKLPKNLLTKNFLNYFCCFIILTAGLFSSVSLVYGETASKQNSIDLASLDFLNTEGVTTDITDIYGNTFSHKGMLKSDSLENCSFANMILSYDIVKNGTVLITMELHDIGVNGNAPKLTYGSEKRTTYPSPSGYYSATFPVQVGGKTCEAFLAGISEKEGEGSVTADAIETLVINALSKGSDCIDIENADFIDAEKSYLNKSENADTDAQLCWAGTTSNLLRYTGWAAQAVKNGTNKDAKGNAVSMSTEDELFDVFMSAFTDDGGNPYYGFPWFFNGCYDVNDQADMGWSVIDSENYPYKTFTGFIPMYAGKQYVSTIDSNSCENMDSVFEELRAGNGVAMGVTWYEPQNNGTYRSSGGHSTTLWGYIIDPEIDAGNSQRYKKIFFGDPDNDKYDSTTGRSEKPNTVSLVTTEFKSATVDGEYESYWRMKGYSEYNGDNAAITEFNVLDKYSEDIPADTGEGCGSHNLFTDPDLYHGHSYIGFSEDDEQYVFTEGEAKQGIYYFDRMYNLGYTGLVRINNRNVKNTITLKKDGAVVKTDSSSTGSLDGRDKGIYFFSFTKKINDMTSSLSAGDYELVIDFNTDRYYKEAYYANNMLSLKFKIVHDVVYKATAKDTNLEISFSPESDGIYVAAAYNSAGKMTGSYYFSSAKAGVNNTCTFTGAANSTTAKFFRINEDNEPVGEAVIVNVA